MKATRIATLDGVWEVRPIIVFRPTTQEEQTGYTVELDDVDRLIAMADNHPQLDEYGFTIHMGGEPEDNIEVPPGEPTINLIAALRWFRDALADAGPMPAS